MYVFIEPVNALNNVISPEVPLLPLTPLVPEVPEVPLLPLTPDVPLVPEVPLTPDVPDVPEPPPTPNEDVAICNVFFPVLPPTQTYPSLNDAVNEPLIV